jgi:hypothetical protein
MDLTPSSTLSAIRLRLPRVGAQGIPMGTASATVRAALADWHRANRSDHARRYIDWPSEGTPTRPDEWAQESLSDLLSSSTPLGAFTARDSWPT